MNEALSAQSLKENGLGEETMGGEDSTALGQVCNVAAVAQDKGVQVACNGMERSLEQPVLLGSPLPSIGTEVMEIGPLNHKEDAGAEAGDPAGGESNALHQPPRDWLEPLEEDDDAEELDNQMWKVNPLRQRRQVNGKRQTAIKDKKNALKMNSNGRFRRRRRGTDVDGDWLDWPVLGEGWKRKEVFRRSGFSVGKTDTYYKSPEGERVRSKIEMAKYLAGSFDLTMFDFKSGVFLDDRAIRGMKRRKGGNASVTAASAAIEKGAASDATEEGAASFSTEEGAASSGPSLTPEKAGSWDGSCTPPAVPTNTSGQNSSMQKFTPPHVVVSHKAVSPRLMPATRRNGTSPGSPCSPSASPHSVKATSVPLSMPLRRGGSVLSLCLTDIAHQGFSAPSTPSRDVPPLNLPYLNPSLIPLSPASSPERNYKPALQDQCLLNSPVSSAPSGAPSPLSAPCTSNLPLNGVLTLFDSSVSLPRTCIKCGTSFHDEEIVEPDGASLCPSCRPKEEQTDTQSSIVFRRVGQRERVLGKASRTNEGRAISERQPNTGRRKRTDIWMNFTFDARRNKSRCKLCSLTLMGKNTTNLKRHLQIFHPEIHAKLKKSPFDRRGPLNEKGHCIPSEYFTSSPKKTRKTSILLKKQKVLRTNARCLVYSEAKRLKKQYTISHHSEPEGFLLDSDNAESPPGSPQGRSKRQSRRSRRACWKCDACLRTTDCGKCDFCMDKPKFGGSNKKRQKCRLRQCQSQAMRHLLPLQLVQSKRRGWMGRRRKRAGHSRSKLRKTWEDFRATDDDSDEDSAGGLAPSMEDEHISDNGVQSFGRYASQMAGAMFAPSFVPGFGRLDTEALYISSYPLPVQAGPPSPVGLLPGLHAAGRESVPDPLLLPRQACYQGNSGMLEMMKMTDFAARTLDAEQPLPPPGSEAVFNPAALMPDAAAGALGLAVGDDVRIVEVDTGEAEVTPVITEIFSLAESSPLDGGVDQELLRLLEALRRAVLPAHWVGVMVTGPRLQLLQCSKLSTMADTVLHIEPDFSYHVSVQELPLLLTHRLYEAHPPRLASTTEVTALLLDLEHYSVCQGYPAFEMPHREPVLHMRAAACELLVLQSEERCDKCDVTSLVL